MPHKTSRVKKKPIQKVPESVCVPIYFKKYQDNKERLLRSQVSTIKCIQHAKNFHEFKDTKKRLSKELRTLSAQVINNIERLSSALPEIQNSKRGIKKIEKNESMRFLEKKGVSHGNITVSSKKSSTLDNELMEIQKRLQELNS